MRRPRIGIPLSLDDRGRWRAGRDYLYIDERYALAIERAGGTPLQLPIQSGVADLIESIDGLLLPGGDDFPSDRALPEDAVLELVPDRQLAFDTRLLAEAALRGRPTLGICYGMQLIARAAGGVLEPHLPSSGVGAAEHRLPEPARHAITPLPGSRLEAILGSGALDVNSLHHQAIRSLASVHRAVAVAPDGVIEAIERTDEPERWEIGVQWHPEKMDERSSDALFAAFVEAARARIGAPD